MLKGSAKIQLFDSKTGKLTDEVEEHNLVTNAVNDLMSEIVRDWVNSYNGKYGSFPVGKVCENGKMVEHNDFIQNFYGGMLVFSSHIAEGVEHTFPTVDEAVSQIGHAGLGAADSTDTAAGSFNAAESSFDKVNRRYQFVWDFGTQACNGDIAAICLTSAACGQAGYFKDGAYNEYNYGVNFDTSRPYPNAPYTKRYNPGNDRIDNEYFNGGVPMDTIGIGSTINSYDDVKVDMSTATAGYTIVNPRANKGYYYLIYYKVNNNDNNITYDFRCFDYDRKTYHDFNVNATDFVAALKANDGIPDGWKNNSDGNVFWNNYWGEGLNIYIDDEKMEVYVGKTHAVKDYPTLVVGKLRVKDGSYVTNEITIPDEVSGSDSLKGRPVRFADMLGATTLMCINEYDDYKSMRSTSIPVLLTDTLDIRIKYCMYNFHPKASDTDSTECAPTRKNMRGYKMYASEATLYDMYYLATINNQTNVLTKTRDKTMKVIYTITEV